MKKQQIRKPFLFKITNRAVLFLFFLSLAIFFFYTAGNVQEFSDESQKLLLNIVRILTAATAVFIFAGIVQLIIYLVKTEKRGLVTYVFLYVFFLIVSIVLFLFANGTLFAAK